jgi:RNA polymerase sigma-70 factor, ECF subfamily
MVFCIADRDYPVKSGPIWTGGPTAHRLEATIMPDDDSEDTALMRRLADADNEALRSLYRRYGGLVYGIALKLTGDGAVAEEVAQEVFVSAWRGAASYRADRGAVVTWLGRIARNKAIDARRAMKARGGPARDEWSVEDESEDQRTPGPEEEASRSMRVREVRTAVAELPEAQRSALSLAFFQGLSHSEIAAALSLPLGTVKSRIRDAMHNLRELLGDRGEG